jgi:hypothetical protein
MNNEWQSLLYTTPPCDETIVLALTRDLSVQVVYGYVIHEKLDEWEFTHWLDIPALPGR